MYQLVKYVGWMRKGQTNNLLKTVSHYELHSTALNSLSHVISIAFLIIFSFSLLTTFHFSANDLRHKLWTNLYKTNYHQ